jgi:hypothetical protein
MKLKTIYQTAIAVVFSVAVGLSAVSAEEPKTLSADEIKKAFVGNTMDHEKVYVFWAPDGTLKGKLKGRDVEDTGKYTIKDDGTYCRAWSEWRGGTEQCAKIKKAGDFYARVALDGTVASTFNILKGNPEGL